LQKTLSLFHKLGPFARLIGLSSSTGPRVGDTKKKERVLWGKLGMVVKAEKTANIFTDELKQTFSNSIHCEKGG